MDFSLVEYAPAVNLVEYAPVVKTVTDGSLPKGTIFSIWDDGDGTIGLVVGAEKRYSSACYLGKGSLQELIDALQEVHEVMR